MKLSSINNIHVKQHNNGSFIFKFTRKYMLGNVSINKIHAGQCVYISVYCREDFSHRFNFFVASNFKAVLKLDAKEKDFSMEQLPVASHVTHEFYFN